MNGPMTSLIGPGGTDWKKNGAKKARATVTLNAQQHEILQSNKRNEFLELNISFRLYSLAKR